MSDPAATDINACLLALLPWTILVINDAPPEVGAPYWAYGSSKPHAGRFGGVSCGVDSTPWTKIGEQTPPILIDWRKPEVTFDWKVSTGPIEAPKPSAPKEIPTRAYIIAPDYSRAIPLEAVEFRRDEAGRVVWSEGEWPADAKPLSQADLDHLKTMKAKS